MDGQVNGLISECTYGSIQVYSGDSSDTVREAPQYVPRASHCRHDLGGLDPHFFSDRTGRQLHRAPIGVADAVHILQR